MSTLCALKKKMYGRNVSIPIRLNLFGRWNNTQDDKRKNGHVQAASQKNLLSVALAICLFGSVWILCQEKHYDVVTIPVLH